MHLSSLTMRGFKSFASVTTLRFEPGMTAVVGPNGSGKSNVVDAIAWVLGEQGAKSLRGGAMQDVIFAGTAGRPPLGRAEVVLTIDNGDGALPVDGPEVTISRLMYRSGASEYAINGRTCRLLDVQELLSDSGIGREMHVIVGQGQLDEVLSARPEDRRGFIEEAAGVLKHRKRKEKALRKLEAMAGNLHRVGDLTAELRRQLGPLGRQAEVARRAAGVQADLRDARLRLLADDLQNARVALAAEIRDETAVRERRGRAEAELAEGRRSEADLEARAADAERALAAAAETYYRLEALRERLRGTAGLAAERQRGLAPEQDTLPLEPDPASLTAQAAGLREQEAALAADLAAARAELAGLRQRREALETAASEADGTLVRAARAAADRREGLARLHGQVAALQSGSAAAAAEIGRLSDAYGQARQRADRAQAEFTALETEVAGLDDGEVGLDERYERAVGTLAAASRTVADLQAQEREAERERAALAARREALALGLARRDGALALLGPPGGPASPGVTGTLAAALTVEAGAEAAVAAALGSAADALVVAELSDAVRALERLTDGNLGRATLLVAAPGGARAAAGTAVGTTAGTAAGTTPGPTAGTTRGPGAGTTPGPVLPTGARWAAELVQVPPALQPALAAGLADTVVVADLKAAQELVREHPALRAVTRAGDLLAASVAVGGSVSAPSRLELQAAVDAAAAALQGTTARCERLRFALATASREHVAADGEVQECLARLHESDAQLAAVAEQLGRLGAAARAGAEEADRLAAARGAAEEARDRDLAGLAALEERLAAALAEPAESEPDPAARDAVALELAAARTAETDARLAVRTVEERVRALAGRAESLDRSAAAARAARERRAARRVRRERASAVARAVAIGAAAALDLLGRTLGEAAAARDAAAADRAAAATDLERVRASVRAAGATLEELVDAAHRDDVARTEQRLRIEALEARSVGELGVDADLLVAEYGPEVPLPPTTPDAAPVPYDRGDQERRARSAETALARLGRVNPLALEEYAALEERHAFLAAQVEDLKATRRDLLTVVAEVDERVQQAFAAAFADVAREFEAVFDTLFPGGEGRLVLTDPGDLLTSGVEVEARPPGKKVKRLSLLSGGERSLTAIALLVAIFRARPSPFYVLDEVEAALDDRNLARLVDLFDGLRTTSQLLVITHQKRTMQSADALYGVSMRGDGISTVISQRLREGATAS